MERPKTRYARNGDVGVAYQVVDQTGGDEPLDLIIVPGLVSHLDLTWEDLEHAQFCKELARFSRLILFDKRGTGLSDRDAGVPDLKTRVGDTLAVMEAADARHPVMFGDSEGGKMSLLFAATHPRRIRALALYGTFVHSPTHVWPEEQVETRFDLVERAWGTAAVPPTVAPSRAADQEFRRNWARFERMSASASMAAALIRIDRESDISHVLPRVRMPTLLLHRSGDRRISVENGRDLAARLPNAQYVELPGDDHLHYLGDSDRIVAEIENFLATLPRLRTDNPDSGHPTRRRLEPVHRASAAAPYPRAEIHPGSRAGRTGTPKIARSRHNPRSLRRNRAVPIASAPAER
jgi:pimeloyl-ACP methyl ester carboxylesterase